MLATSARTDPPNFSRQKPKSRNAKIKTAIQINPRGRRIPFLLGAMAGLKGSIYLPKTVDEFRFRYIIPS
jgi:hypothetical protein